MPDTYPLEWPAGYDWTPAHKRIYSRFKATPGAARDNLFKEIERLGARNVVLSTNVRLRQDGSHYKSVRELQEDLRIQLAKGRRLIKDHRCDNFDPIKGCLGHEG